MLQNSSSSHFMQMGSQACMWNVPDLPQQPSGTPLKRLLAAF